jgi:hypothetical protein
VPHFDGSALGSWDRFGESLNRVFGVGGAWALVGGWVEKKVILTTDEHRCGGD